MSSFTEILLGLGVLFGILYGSMTLGHYVSSGDLFLLWLGVGFSGIGVVSVVLMIILGRRSSPSVAGAR